MREVGSGKIAVYFENRGFGFIHGIGEFRQYFFHVRQCSFEPKVGALVQFEVSEGPKGLAALNVRELAIAGIQVLASKSGGAA
jgi:cold shock CspA family protein